MKIRCCSGNRAQAQVLSAAGDSEGGWSCLQEALALSPKDALVLIVLADRAETLGRYDELAELGRELVDHNIRTWTLMLKVLRTGEHCPHHLRGSKP